MTDAELARLYELIRVPSVSADPGHAADMGVAADLMAAEVRLAGGEVEISTCDGHPLVIGQVAASSGDPGAPRIIVYGHYDVQPPGDPDLWTTPAFDPVVRDGQLFARGASDDKGNLFMLLVAVQRLAGAGELPVRVTFVIDGEEESGGDSAMRWLAADAEPAHCAVIFDGPMVGPDHLSLCTGLRGMVYRRVTVRTAAADGHSGLFGGGALNAAHALMAALAAIMPTAGAVDDALATSVAAIDPDERMAWADLPSGAEVLASAGLRPADAAAADDFYLRTTGMPSIDVHGLACGEPGAVKTNIPSLATATVSMRIAPGQDAHSCAEAFDRLLTDATPVGAELTIEDLGVAAPAFLDPRHPVMVAARSALAESTGWPVSPVRIGGSIPIVAAFTARNIPAVLTGFGLPDDGIHAPDEHIRFDHLETGAQAAMDLLVALGAASLAR